MEWYGSFKEGLWGIATVATGGLVTGGLLGQQSDPYAAARQAADATSDQIYNDPLVVVESMGRVVGGTAMAIANRAAGGAVKGAGEEMGWGTMALVAVGIAWLVL